MCKGSEQIMTDCDYNDIMVDCIIDGVHDKKLQGRLLAKGEAPTLAQAIETGLCSSSCKKPSRSSMEWKQMDTLSKLKSLLNGSV